MRKQEKEQERKVVVAIRSSRRKAATLDTWRYWEIVGELRRMGADYVQATDAAKWAQRAKPGEICELLPHSTIADVMNNQKSGPLNIIKMEVKDGETD